MVEQTYDRLALARIQLDTALYLFLDQKNYPATITLAGAAEEIFGRALSIGGGKAALERKYELLAETHRIFPGKELNKRCFVSRENLARDALKHLQENIGSTVTIDLEDAACWMLVRAIQNGTELGFDFERYQDFDDWFYENIIGV